MHRSENTNRRSSVPDAMRAAALSEREEMLIDEIRLAGETPSYRRRQKIEVELSDVRRDLELLCPDEIGRSKHERELPRRREPERLAVKLLMSANRDIRETPN